ncbi:FMN-binding protein [Lachnospiraceae bacterium MD1]|uniref:FMN-binding protein n=1 Tax=Variimorphobacter saccharofermentans TaxID=2755051 RepID=A0A839K5K5_9FIRM|nr:FMN-binding protein [Variimorphobacter saccharofermentans]MBB2184339.1 FMN-binding protein [Variimorphobacter saccharofermentans]
MSKKKRNLVILIGLILIIGIISLLVYLAFLSNYQNKVAAIEIQDIDFSDIPDGTYYGECDVNFIRAKVSVTMENGIITDITLLEHKNGEGKPAERIIDDIIKAQSLEVDAVSGATNSCKVITQAIMNALENK